MMDNEKDAGGASENDTSGNTQKKETVAYETYQKTVSQYKKSQSLMADMQAKIDGFETKIKASEESKLEEDGELRKVIDLRNDRVKELEDKIAGLEGTNKELNGSIIKTDKLSAFYDKLPGKIKRPEFLRFVNLEGIVLDPETGSVDSNSVDMEVNNFMEKYNDLVETGDFNTPPGDASNSTKSFTMSEWQKLPPKEKRAQMANVYKSETT